MKRDDGPRVGWREFLAQRKEAKRKSREMMHDLGRQTGMAKSLLARAIGDEQVVSVGSIWVNGGSGEHAFSYRLTPERLVWNRMADPQPDGFAFDEVRLYCLAQSNQPMVDRPVVRVDLVDGRTLDLLVGPAEVSGPGLALHQKKIIGYILGQLSDHGAGHTQF